MDRSEVRRKRGEWMSDYIIQVIIEVEGRLEREGRVGF